MRVTASKLGVTAMVLGLLLGASLIHAHPEPVEVTARVTAHAARAVVYRDIADPMIDVFAVAEARVAAVYDGITAELTRAADYVASVPPPPPPSIAAAPFSTDASAERGGGGHSDAWWSGVAMCEQGGKNDPYYGYFSFMDGSQGGRPWDEQVAAGNALLASAGREVGPWAAACVAAGYAASPSG